MNFKPDLKAYKEQIIERLAMRAYTHHTEKLESWRDLPKKVLDECEKQADEFVGRLKPGEYKSHSQLYTKGCGECDAVIFLRERYRFELKEQKKIKDPETGQEYIHAAQDQVIVEGTAEMRALHYVKPMSDNWHFDNGWDRPGVCKPHDIHFLLTPEIRQKSIDDRRLLGWLFRQDDKGINAIQPEHRGRWMSFQVEKDIWAILYV